MKKVYIALIISSLFAGSGISAKELSYTNNQAGIEGVTQSLSGTEDDSTLTVKGHYKNGIHASSGDVTLDNWSSITVDLDNNQIKQGVNGLSASNGHTLKIDGGSLDVKGIGATGPGVQDPVAIHAYGGTVEINTTADVKLYAEGNAVMSQATQNGPKNGLVKIKTTGDVTIESTGAAVLAGLLQNGLGQASSKVEVDAKNISITSVNNVAVEIYDADKTWNPDDPRAGEASVNINAEKKLALTGLYGVYQLRKGAEAPTGSVSNFSAGEEMVITGSAYGVRANTEGGSTAPNKINFSAPSVSIAGKSEAAVSAEAGAELSFNGVNGARTQITLASGKDALKTTSGSTVSFSKADVSVSSGNVSSEGTVGLANSTIDLAAGSVFKSSTVTGSSSSIIINGLAESGSTVEIGDNQSTGLTVKASGSLNDKYADAQAAASALKDAVNITEAAGSGSHSFAGEAGTLSDAWTAEKTADGKVAVTSVTENSTVTAVEHFNAMTLVHWVGEMNHLSQRLGDVRDSSAKAGAWARVYGYDSSYKDAVKVDYKANSIQAGGDYRVDDTWLVGGAFSYTDGEGTFANGSSDTDGWSIAAYASGFFDCGAYVDVIGRAGRLSTDITASGGSSLFHGSYDNTTFGLSAEVGWHWKASEILYVEPQAELAYGFVKGSDFTSSNGVSISQDDFQTLVGRLGVRTGATFADGAGTVYAHASVNHDFMGDADYLATSAGAQSRTISVDLGATWISYGIGAQFNTSQNLNFYGMLERSSGSDYSEDYRYSVGMRYAF